ncbi:rho GDP-dissociation inhibitor [Streptomyces antimicrobicus]|uniref:Rho GDP-dissociation inhibitor n=1 Tax=Streptomyces antimicrobicus TaxID=2883108 RepID=A0ABS8B5D6_9ACTN|nr:rho GDP-dissociation inhibitor [Streptomyces antimicrobicus]MCB5179791.1 rho GDP-dissociation inhibitor [Streptomyces antimicrobicus]
MTDARFELLDVHLESESFGRVAVPLDDLPGAPFALPEGALFTVSLTFRLAADVDGLCYVDSREVDGCSFPAVSTSLGSFRAGGPYEVVLPPEKLPAGRHSHGTYTVTGTFMDGDGEILAREAFRYRLTHHERPVCRPAGRAGTLGAGPSAPPVGTAPPGPPVSARPSGPPLP